MELKKISRLKFMTKMPLFYSFFFFFFFFFVCFLCFSVFALLSSTMITTKNPSLLDIKCHSTTKSGFNFQDFERDLKKIKSKSKRMNKLSMAMTRRILSGPGSWPPQCTAKCGNCTPCRPVHVSVPPGIPVTTEYYPEAWRCKCGNRLYMP